MSQLLRTLCAPALVWLAAAPSAQHPPRWEDARLVLGETALAPLRIEALPESAAPASPHALVVDGIHLQFRRTDSHWDVTASVEGDPTPIWTHTQTSAPEPEYDGGYLLAARRPHYPWPALRPLTALGERVLVCGGPRESLLCLDPHTGEALWELEALWEFERSFMGPSVWSHTVSREGESDFGQLAAEERATRRERRNGERREHLLAGPAVVSGSDWGGSPSHAIYMMVAHASSGRWASYRADCTLYEIDARGAVRALSPMPRLAEAAFESDGERVLWSLTEGAWASIEPSPSFASGPRMGPGGPDCRARIAWFRDNTYAVPEGTWLAHSGRSSSIAFGATYAYRPAYGGLIPRADGGLLRIPIQRVERASGALDLLHLDLAFDGPELRNPETNYNWVRGTYFKAGAYVAGLRELALEGDELSFDVVPTGGAPSLVGEGRRLVFDASALADAR